MSQAAQDFFGPIKSRLKSVIENGRNEGGTEFQPQRIGQYLDRDQFAGELQALKQKFPILLGHESEVPNTGDYVVKDLFGQKLILVRDESGQLRVFNNICRHRGSPLLLTEKGNCRRSIKCPYHSWTYSSDGKLLGIPEGESGFAGIDKSQHGLLERPIVNAQGLLFTALTHPIENAPIDCFKQEFGLMDVDKYSFFNGQRKRFQFNWKLGVNSFLESYHFSSLHADSVGPIYFTNRRLVDEIQNNFRISIPKSDFMQSAVDSHDFSGLNMTYFIFPSTVIFFVGDHLTLLRFLPHKVDETDVEMWLLVPPNLSEKQTKYYQRNWEIYVRTAEEDLVSCEGIQKNLDACSDGEFVFGSFEAPIIKFHKNLGQAIG